MSCPVPLSSLLRTLAINAGFVCAVVLAASASDQTVIISQKPTVCSVPIPATFENMSSAVPAIEVALGVTSLDPNTYYIVHDVTYNSDFSVSEQHWYVYYAGWQNPSEWVKIEDPRIAKHFTESRIYGGKQLALAYFHRNVPATTADMAIARASANAANKLDSVQVGYLVRNKIVNGDQTLPTAADIAKINAIDPAAGAALQQKHDDEDKAYKVDLISDSTSATLVGFSPRAPAAAPPGTPTLAYVVDGNFKSLVQSLSYTIDITKKVPAPIQNLEGIVGIIYPKAQAEAPSIRINLDQITLCGGQPFTVSALPSDMIATATVGSAGALNSGSGSKQIGKNTFDNEQKYWYDFSFALPLKSYQDLTVSSSDLTVTAKKVDKQSLFAVLNLSPFPYDTKKASFQLLPVFLYGMPITGHPLNHHLIALAVGLNRVQFFAGVLVDHNKSAPGSSVSGSSSGTSTSSGPIKDYWSAKLSYGINFPVSTITSLLKPKK